MANPIAVSKTFITEHREFAIRSHLYAIRDQLSALLLVFG
jgi:hypothetical protein